MATRACIACHDTVLVVDVTNNNNILATIPLPPSQIGFVTPIYDSVHNKLYVTIAGGGDQAMKMMKIDLTTYATTVYAETNTVDVNTAVIVKSKNKIIVGSIGNTVLGVFDTSLDTWLPSITLPSATVFGQIFGVDEVGQKVWIRAQGGTANRMLVYSAADDTITTIDIPGTTTIINAYITQDTRKVYMLGVSNVNPFPLTFFVYDADLLAPVTTFLANPLMDTVGPIYADEGTHTLYVFPQDGSIWPVDYLTNTPGAKSVFNTGSGGFATMGAVNPDASNFLVLGADVYLSSVVPPADVWTYYPQITATAFLPNEAGQLGFFAVIPSPPPPPSGPFVIFYPQEGVPNNKTYLSPLAYKTSLNAPSWSSWIQTVLSGGVIQLVDNTAVLSAGPLSQSAPSHIDGAFLSTPFTFPFSPGTTVPAVVAPSMAKIRAPFYMKSGDLQTSYSFTTTTTGTGLVDDAYFAVLSLDDGIGTRAYVARKFDFALGRHIFESAAYVNNVLIQKSTISASSQFGKLRIIAAEGKIWFYVMDGRSRWTQVGYGIGWPNDNLALAPNIWTQVAGEIVTTRFTSFSTQVGILFGDTPAVDVLFNPAGYTITVPQRPRTPIGPVDIVAFDDTGTLATLPAHFTYLPNGALPISIDGGLGVTLQNSKYVTGIGING